MKESPLEELVGELLRRQGLRLATAESCSGGLIGDRLTDVPGSSDYFLGGVIAYANQVKIEQLGVRLETLLEHGAVSQETVLEMARGVRQAFHADIGLAVSGIAGPGGGTPDKPVGLVWIALSSSTAAETWSAILPGDRLQVKAQTAEQALRLLADYLEQPKEYGPD